MVEPLKTVAILAAQPALNALLSAVLAGAPNLRVRSFESDLTLEIYMRITRVDLVVVDCDDIEPEVVSRLRADDQIGSRFRALALASELDRDLKRRCDDAGLTEIVVKPMSPRYLLERVQARLMGMAERRVAIRAEQHDVARYSNVIPLWTKDRPRPVA